MITVPLVSVLTTYFDASARVQVQAYAEAYLGFAGSSSTGSGSGTGSDLLSGDLSALGLGSGLLVGSLVETVVQQEPLRTNKTDIRNEENEVTSQERTSKDGSTLASGTITNVGEVVLVGKVRVGWFISTYQESQVRKDLLAKMTMKRSMMN